MRVMSFLLAAAAATPAAAQGVRIRVVDDAANAPVAGALVSLRHAGTRIIERLTNSSGERILGATSDTGYVVEVRRVGYPVFTSQRFALAAADTQALELRLPGARTTLAPPATRTSCRVGSVGRDGAGELWEQLRTALTSSEIVRTESLEPLAIRRFERTLSRDGKVRAESRMDSIGLGTRPFRTESPHALSRAGFARTDSLGLTQFSAPDAAVLTSEEFARDHCFSLVGGTGPTAGMIGLHFEPVPGRRVTEVEGALWADLETSQLRVVEFAYRLPGKADVRGAGGRILFEQLSGASWIAREWELRTPVLTTTGQLIGYREEGGEAMVVTPRMRFVLDSLENSRKLPGLITGVIVDSLTGAGFAGARVWLDSAGLSTRTDAKGVFFLRGVAPGRHIVRFTHPLLDSIGVWPRAAELQVVSEQMADVRLAGPSLATLKAGACADSVAVVAGVVRDAASGAPVDSADVTLTWIEIRIGRNRLPEFIAQRSTIARTDSTGRYGACVTAGVEVTAYAERGVARSGRVDLTTDARKLGVQHIWLDLTAPDSLEGSAELRGAVRYQDGSPLSNAVVTLSDPEYSTTTDTNGRFRLPNIPGGTRVVDTRALGHAPARTIAELKPGEPTDVTIYMRRVTMLDPVLVRAAADGQSARTLLELAERERRRMGDRVNASQLRSFGDRHLDAVFRSLPYARVALIPIVTLDLINTRGDACTPSVWLDGRRSTAPLVLGLRAIDVLSIEVMRLRGQVPVEYQEFSDCGAVLIWLRPR